MSEPDNKKRKAEEVQEEENEESKFDIFVSL